MRIVAYQKVFYDWPPLPDGVEPTQADIDQMLVKRMVDDSWHMRVETISDPPREFEAGYPEEAIAKAHLTAQILRDPKTRAQVVVDLFSRQMRNHGAPNKFSSMTIIDDGAQADIYKGLADSAVLDGGISQEDADSALQAYSNDKQDIGQFLNFYYSVGA